MAHCSKCRLPNSKATYCLSSYFEVAAGTVAEGFADFVVFACSVSCVDSAWSGCFWCLQQSDGTFACCRFEAGVSRRTRTLRSGPGFLSGTGCLKRLCCHQSQRLLLSSQNLLFCPFGHLGCPMLPPSHSTQLSISRLFTGHYQVP